MLFVFIRNGVRSLVKASLVFGGLLCGGLALAQDASAQSPAPQPTPAPVNEAIVVSATRSPETELEIPGEATVVTGEQLRARGVTNLADGIQDVMGVDTGMGSDNGPRQPNVGIWGLKEFDALLFMVDGVPIGGPFLPQLAQIDIGDIDRIEIVKGPQGTLYGASAFTGMVQVFTKGGQGGSTISIAGGSFNEGRINGSTVIPIGKSTLRLFGNFDKLTNGWQPNTDYQDGRGGFRIDTPLPNGGSLSFGYTMFLNQQQFGSPLPVDPPSGTVIPGFKPDNNYEPIGARVDHRVYAVTVNATIPLNKTTSLQNVLGLTKDDATIAQSFVTGFDRHRRTTSPPRPAAISSRRKTTSTTTSTSSRTSRQPEATGSWAARRSRPAGSRPSGYSFDFDFQIDPVIVPNLTDIPRGSTNSVRDDRTFIGLYAERPVDPGVRF